MTQNRTGNSAVQEQVIVQDIPPLVERIQEQIVDTIDVTLQGSQFAPNTSSTSTSHFDITSSSSTSTTNNRLDALEIIFEFLNVHAMSMASLSCLCPLQDGRRTL